MYSSYPDPGGRRPDVTHFPSDSRQPSSYSDFLHRGHPGPGYPGRPDMRNQDHLPTPGPAYIQPARPVPSAFDSGMSSTHGRHPDSWDRSRINMPHPMDQRPTHPAGPGWANSTGPPADSFSNGWRRTDSAPTYFNAVDRRGSPPRQAPFRRVEDDRWGPPRDSRMDDWRRSPPRGGHLRHSSPPRRGGGSSRGHASTRPSREQERKPASSSRKAADSPKKSSAIPAGKSVKELKDEEIEKAAKMQIAMMADMEAKAREKELKSETKSKPTVPEKAGSSASSANVPTKKDEKLGAVKKEPPTPNKKTDDTGPKKSTDAAKVISSPAKEVDKPVIVANAKFEDVHLFHLKGDKKPSPQKNVPNVNTTMAGQRSEESWFKQYKDRISHLKTSSQRTPAALQSVPPTFAARGRPDFPPAFPPADRAPAHVPNAVRTPYPAAAAPPGPRPPAFFNDERRAAPLPDRPYNGAASRAAHAPAIPAASSQLRPGNTADPYSVERAQYRSRYDEPQPMPGRNGAPQKPAYDQRPAKVAGELDPMAYVEELSDMGDDWNEVVALLKESPKPQKRPVPPTGYPVDRDMDSPDRSRKVARLASANPHQQYDEKTFFRNSRPQRSTSFSDRDDVRTTSTLPPRPSNTERGPPNAYPERRPPNPYPEPFQPRYDSRGPPGPTAPPQSRIAPAAAYHGPGPAYDAPGPRSDWHNSRGPPTENWKSGEQFPGNAQHSAWRNQGAGPSYFR